MRRARSRRGIANARVVSDRSEELALPARARGLRRGDRPRGRPPLHPGRAGVAAAREGGVLVAWKGRRDPEEEAELAARPSRWRCGPSAISRWRPSPAAATATSTSCASAARHRRDLPRRPGMAEEAPVRRLGPARPALLSWRRPRCGTRLSRWAPSTRSRTRRAGSARRRPPSTWPPASPPPARQTLLVDLDPQCNATVALGGDREAHPSSYDCLIGEVSVAEAARPAGPDNLWLVPASRDLAGASVELPRIEGSETRLRERLGPVRERFDFTLLDCPPSLGPDHRQRPGRRRPRDRPGPGRVPRARGPGPVPRHAGADPPRAEPGAGAVGRA